VDRATYFDKLYAYPYQTTVACSTTGKICSTKYDLKPPTIWGEMTAACQRVKAGENVFMLSGTPASSKVGGTHM
jgi:hypothetical protein